MNDKKKDHLKDATYFKNRSWTLKTKKYLYQNEMK